MTSNYTKKSIIMSVFLLIIGAVMLYLATVDIINYAVASLFVGIAIVVAFFVLFEHKRAKATMIVLITTLSALAIVGRWAFAWAPNVTLSTGIVILAGVSLGGVPGFMVGALTMFVSNMLLGQGLFTVWQMLSAGLIGLIAGLFKKADKIALSVYAIFSGFAYGFIMDICTLITAYGSDISWQKFLVVWGASFYFDLVHALSTMATVLIFYGVIVSTIRKRLDK